MEYIYIYIFEGRREEKREAHLQRVCRGCPICLTYCSGGKLKGKSTIHSKRINKFEKHPGPTPLKASAAEYHDGIIQCGLCTWPTSEF